MKVSPLLAFAALAALSSAQSPPNLATYLKAHPVAASLTVSAEEGTPIGTGERLARYSRKAVKLGTVNAIVPIDMIEFDDSLREPPNLYDGLPRGSKVLYLLSTLDASQMAKAAGDGIGLSDLQGEQAKVFLSILPKTVKWTKQRLGENGAWGKEIAKGTYDAAAVKAMRIRVERRLMFEMPLADGSQGYTFHSADEESGLPGGVALFRDSDDEMDRPDSFGVTVRKTVPNVPKKGQLDTKALDAMVTVPAATTVGETLALVGRASGREILADLRVRSRKVAFNGGKARAGDLLDALALAVEGTYRQVGSAYLLASDVTGLGARKLRLSIWEQDLQYALRHKEAAWKRALETSGGLAKVGYDEASGLSPSPEMLKTMAERKPGNEWDSTANYTPTIRAFIDRVNLRYSHQKVVTDRARARWRMGYRFINPEGEPFGSEEDELVNDFDVDPNRFGRGDDRAPIPPFERVALAPEKGAGLALTLRTADEAVAAVAVAKRYGFAELWATTTQPEALSAAVGTGFPVRLLVRPWTASPGTRADALDRSILGETESQAAARVRASEATLRAAQGPVRTGWEREPLELDPSDVYSPFAPSWAARRAALLALASTPGLKGVILTGLRPRGYEGPGDGRTSGVEREELVAAAAMGYTEAARLAFLRKEGIDPVDLSGRNVRFGADLRPPFFLDDNLRGSPTVYDGTQTPLAEMEDMANEWAKALAEANARAVDRFFAGLTASTVLVEMPRPPHTSGGEGTTTLVPWTKGTPLPTAMANGQVDPKDIRGLFSLPGEGETRRLEQFGRMMPYLAKAKTFPGAFDLSTIAPAKWEAILGAWFVRR